MNHKMTQKNHKTTTLLLAIAVIACILVGTGHTAFAGAKFKLFYSDINKQIDTSEDQKCKTTGRSFPMIGGTVVCQLCHCHSVMRNIPFWTLV
jgi:hypothetical protein